MKLKLSHIVAAGSVLGFLGIGGLNLAGAQESTDTTTPSITQDDSTSTTTDDSTAKEDCPLHEGTTSDSDTSDSSTSGS